VISRRLARPRNNLALFSGATSAERLDFFLYINLGPPRRDGKRSPGTFFPPRTESAI
jgi:hypothetical protein